MKRTLALLACLGLVACGEEPSPAPPASQAGPAKAPAPPPRPAWPPMAEGQALADNPTARNYYVVFDASGSMNERRCTDGETKLEAARAALAAFAASLPADAHLGLLSFDAGGIRERLPLATSSRERLEPTVARLRAGGTTPLRSAMAAAYRSISEQGGRQLGYGEYHLVVVTDGEFTPGSEDPGRVVAEILERSPVVIHTIGFCIGEQHSLNQPGRTLYTAANSPDELRRGLEDVLAESPSFDVISFR